MEGTTDALIRDLENTEKENVYTIIQLELRNAFYEIYEDNLEKRLNILLSNLSINQKKMEYSKLQKIIGDIDNENKEYKVISDK